MNLKYHFIVSLAISLFLFPFFGCGSFLVMVGGFLIDIDHYIWYILRYRDFNIKNAYKRNKNHDTKVLNIFHQVDVIALFIILSFLLASCWRLPFLVSI